MNNSKIELPDGLKDQIRVSMLKKMNVTVSNLFEIELFDWYINENEKVLNHMIAEEVSYIQEQIKAGDPEPNDSGIVATDYYLKRIRYSHVIYLTSLLETCLRRACDKLIFILKDKATPFDAAVFKGNQWTKRYKYLEHYGQLKFPKALLSQLDLLIMIRNFLVHENGSTTKIQAEQKIKLHTCSGINVNDDEFVIEKEYVSHASKVMKEFVTVLEGMLQQVLQRVKASQSIL